MSKTLKTLMAAGAVATSLTLAPASAMADAPEASAGVANLYLFRGLDLSDGNASLFGDLTYDLGGGVSASAWISSEGNDSGGEVDFILGWGGEIGGVDVGAGVINYYYPGGSSADDADTFGAFSEAYVTLGVAGVDLGIYKNVAGDIGYQYYTLGYSHESLSFMLGMADYDDSSAGSKTEYSYSHFDVTYSVTDRLSFTVSKIFSRDYDANGFDADDLAGGLGGGYMDDDGNTLTTERAILTDATGDDDTLFVVTYTLPIDLK